jgi:quercetin dioxygenase-like cupin family protein
MKVGRIYATPDGESHIGELEIALTQNEGRPLFYNSTRFAATTIGFQCVRAGGSTAWHNPPQRWVAFILDGTWEIEASDGSRRQFPAGSVSVVEDTTGKGHRGRAVGDADVLVAAVSLPDEAVVA